MRKIFISLFFFFILHINVYAGWYGGTPAIPGGSNLITYSGNTTWCPEDGDPAIVAPAPGVINLRERIFPGGPLGNYSYDSQFSAIFGTNQMFCQYWDGDVPDNLFLSYVPYGARTSDVTITARARDIGGSQLQKIELWQRTNGAAVYTLVNTWNNPANNVNQTWVKPYPTGTTTVTTYSYKIIAYDKSGNVAPELVNGNVIIFDGVPPAANALYNDGWFNSVQTVNVTASDTVGLQRVQLFRSADNGVTFSQVANWNGLGGVLTYSNSFSQSPVNNAMYIFRVVATDTSGNTYTYTSPNVMRFDLTVPTDVTFNPIGFDKLATNAAALGVKAADEADGIGAPSGELQFVFERASDPNFITNGIPHHPMVSNPYYNFTADIRTVDGSDFNTTIGGRQYTVRFTKICDIAGNCRTTTLDKTFNVYANSLVLGTTGVTLNELSSPGVANGDTKRIQITLKDFYGNNIRKAPGISRTIDFNFNNAINTMYLDQFKRIGSSIFNSTPNNGTTFTNTLFPINTSSQIRPVNDQNIGATGIYEFGFKVYTPTKEGYKGDPTADFILSDINFDVNGSLGNNPGMGISGSNIDFNFSPYIQTVLGGDLKNNGLLEGQNQNSSITVTRNGVAKSETNPRVRVEFGSGAREPVTDFDMKWSVSGNPTSAVNEPVQASIGTVTPILTSFTNGNFVTRMDQLVPVPKNQALYFSTHISYTLDGHNVAYNSDIIGKNNYWEDVASSGVQTGIKVSGIGTSTNTGEVISGQFDNDIRVLGSINKAEIKKDLLSKVFATIQKAPINNGVGTIEIIDLQNFANTSNDGTKLNQNSILYFGDLAGSMVTLGDAALATGERVSGKKTIVVYGGDLYIKTNMYYNNPSADILGIIVLEKDGVGGNVYIDKEVTNVVGNIYADKSILNYTGTVETDGNSPFDDMKNQLHILGSVYSENTIGGSRSTPYKCPYYVNSCASKPIAQKYDLNFMRRFYINPATGYPAGNAKVIGGGTCSSGTTCTSPTTFNKYVTTTTDTLLGYSVVIEYHPLLSITPPPLFSK